MKDLLKKWLGGNSTWSEEKNLRRAAEKDDFLFEALEGYDAFPTKDHTVKIKQLKSRLPKSAHKRNRNIAFLPRVAAAAAIIGVIGTFFWVQQKVNTPQVLSDHGVDRMATPAPPLALESEIVAAPEVVINKENNTDQAIIIAKEEVQKNSRSEKSKTAPITIREERIAPQKEVSNEVASTSQSVVFAEESIIAVKEEIPAPKSSATEPIEIAIEENDPSEINTYATEPNIEREKALAKKKSYQKAESASNRDAAAYSARSNRSSAVKKFQAPEKINYYAGVVQNEDGQPLNQVQIKVIGQDIPLKSETNLEGAFVLESIKPLTKIEVTKDGFHGREIAINQYTDLLNIVLTKKSTTITDGTTQIRETIAPRPEEGFMEFYSYLKDNLIYPEAAKQQGIEKEVEIKFFINENGRPTNLKGSESDNFGFEKEAIRLLENGPNWQPINTYARYYVTFELE